LKITQVVLTNVGARKKNQPQVNTATKKTKKDQKWELLMSTKEKKITQYVAKTLKKDLHNDESQVTSLLEIIGNASEQQENCVSPGCNDIVDWDLLSKSLGDSSTSKEVEPRNNSEYLEGCYNSIDEK